MAEPKVRIPIELPAGDMSGAEEAKREIAEVKQAADSAEDPALAKQRIDDVAAARKLASDRRVADQQRELTAEKEAQQAAQDSARLRLAAGAALAASARQVAALTVDVIRQYKELGVELRGFESIGLEFADFLTSPFEFVADAFTDYKADLQALKESQLEVIRQEALYQQTLANRDKLLAAASQRRINIFLAGEEAAIDSQTAALERQLRVVEAIAKQEEARAKALDKIALAGGADPNAVAAGAAARAAAAGGVQEDRRVAAAEQEVENALQRFDALGSALAQASTAAVRDEAAIRELSDQTQAAQAAVGDAQAELETIRVEAAAAKSEIASEAVTQQLDVVDSTKSVLNEAAAEAKAALQEESAKLSAGGKEALKILTDALRDDVVSKEEALAVVTAVQQVKNSRDNADAEIRASFEQLEKANNSFLANQQAMTARLRDQAAQIERLQTELR